VTTTALIYAVTGVPGGAYWQNAFGPRLAGDIRWICPAALAASGRLSERSVSGYSSCSKPVATFMLSASNPSRSGRYLYY